MSRPQGATLTQRRFAAAASGAFDAAFPAQESQSRRDLPIRNESSQPLPVHVTATAVSCVWAHPWPAPPCPRIPVRGRPVAESPAHDRVCAVPSPRSCIRLSLECVPRWPLSCTPKAAHGSACHASASWASCMPRLMGIVQRARRLSASVRVAASAATIYSRCARGRPYSRCEEPRTRNIHCPNVPFHPMPAPLRAHTSLGQCTEAYTSFLLWLQFARRLLQAFGTLTSSCRKAPCQDRMLPCAATRRT